MSTDAALTVLLTSLDPAALVTDTEVLDLARAWDLVGAWVHARGLRAVAEFARRPERAGSEDPLVARARRRPVGQVGRWSPEAEIGAVLALSPAAAELRLATATWAVGRLDAGLRALECGRIDGVRFTALMAETSGCSDEVAASVAAELAAGGGLDSSARFRREARRAVVRADPAGAAERAAAQRRDPFVRTRAGEGGFDVAWLEARLPAEDAHAVRLVLDAAVLAMKARDGEERTADQLRAAALVSPFWAALASGELTMPDGPLPLAPASGRPATLSLIEHADGTCELGGYGFVCAQTAREIRERAISGRWPVVRVDAGFGPQHGRQARDWQVEDAYRPSAGLARLVRHRDQTCRFPGCSAAAATADLDHTVPWPDGPTHPANLAVLCRRHHRVKQAPGYAVEQHDEGRLTWRTPTGHTRSTGPPGQT